MVLGYYPFLWMLGVCQQKMLLILDLRNLYDLRDIKLPAYVFLEWQILMIWIHYHKKRK